MATSVQSMPASFLWAEASQEGLPQLFGHALDVCTPTGYARWEQLGRGAAIASDTGYSSCHFIYSWIYE